MEAAEQERTRNENAAQQRSEDEAKAERAREEESAAAAKEKARSSVKADKAVRKFERMFKQLDADGNGSLGMEEVSLLPLSLHILHALQSPVSPPIDALCPGVL